MDETRLCALVDILQQINVEPTVLFCTPDLNLLFDHSFLDLPWSCVYTTDKSNDLTTKFEVIHRRVIELQSINDSNAIRLNKREMSLVRLLGVEKNEIDEMEQQTTTQALMETIPGILRLYGRILIDYDMNNITMMNHLCVLLNRLSRKDSICFFGVKNYENNNPVKYLANKGVAIVFEESLSECLNALKNSEYEWEETASSLVGEKTDEIKFYINKKVVDFNSPLERELLLNISNFASLMNYYEVEIVGSFHPTETMQRFQAFLQSSTIGKPQWYGYRQNSCFHLKRYFEEDLYVKTKRALKSAGSKERKNKPIMLRGQACSGKTNAICALAYRIFNDKTNPVIFIPNSDVDFSNTYETNDDGIVITQKSNAFLSLEALIKKIEEEIDDPAPTLIIWDTSCSLYSEIKKAYDLLNNLRSAGRQVQIVCTSYEIQYESFMSQDPYNYYDVIDVDPSLKGPKNKCLEPLDYNEVEKVQKMLIDFGGFRPEDADRMIRYYADANTFIGSLYMFRELHRDLKIRLRRENEGRFEDISQSIERIAKEDAKRQASERLQSVMAMKLKEEFERVGRHLAFDEFDNNFEVEKNDYNDVLLNIISCIAFCTIYKERLPMSMVIRLLEKIDVSSTKVFNLVMSNSILRIELSPDDEPLAMIRSELEAQLLLEEYSVSRIDTLKRLIAIMSHQEGSADVRLVQRLLQLTGPNNSNSDLSLWNDNFLGFEEIVIEMKRLREEENCDLLVIQELTLTRELCNHRQGYDDDEKLKRLRAAKVLADEMIEKHSGLMMTSLQANLYVEWANICLRLSKIDKSISKASIYEDVKKKMERVISHFPKNGYAYSAYLWAGIDFASKLQNTDEKLELIQRLCNIVDTIQDDNHNIDIDTNTVGEIDNLMDGISLSEERFNKSIKEGKSYGIYFKIRTIIGLGVNRLDFSQTPNKKNNSYNKCKEIVNIADNPFYGSIIRNDPACMYAAVNAKWMYYSQKPIIPEKENVSIKLSQERWEEFYIDCKRYLELCSIRPARMVYLLALSAAHIAKYRFECEELFDELRKGTNFEKRSLHIISDENGKPLLFSGRISGKYSEDKNRGYIRIDEQGFSNPIYFRADRIGRASRSLRENEGLRNLSIAVSYSGFQICKI